MGFVAGFTQPGFDNEAVRRGILLAGVDSLDHFHVTCILAPKRDSVRNEAVAQRPASGAFDGQTVAQSNAGLSRAEVRAQAIANPPASGVFDGSTVAQQHRVAPTQAAGE